MKAIGQHKRTKHSGEDINRLQMVRCLDCEADSHAIDIPTAEKNLAEVKCAPDCENCKSLRHSYSKKPAVPIDGDCNTILHTCPNDGNRWWQTNGHFHLWKQVTDQEMWKILLRREANPEHSEHSEDGFF
jgi:hypothetical protein